LSTENIYLYSTKRKFYINRPAGRTGFNFLNYPICNNDGSPLKDFTAKNTSLNYKLSPLNKILTFGKEKKMLPNLGILFKNDATYSCRRVEAFVVVRPMETQASI
jgi:hypothetical protein